ncbi:Pls/PosA family non-ribosomal peptide synthetase [Actinomycetospora cinnamomea]|uniref:Non-ribosomal peptide synthetase-like protein n=1 Tax=Actinomycetospora cinnamomea TaxID=663609 RepID=A0A2U1FLR5_9PSEU|nr:Pls/PosA family non-ribosomal peptide synthetase [Actinomycetospora cinnamomea]PVZ13155.1 non-ribosomal peptide synthetase-like protein [Actinomycetospora cinnamomea]
MTGLVTLTESTGGPAGSPGRRPHAGACAPEGRPSLPEARLEHVLERSADATPEATAVEHEGHATSYAELDRRANRLAHVLRERGVRPGARVGLFLGRSLETYVALLGVLKAGAAFVPVDPEAPADRLAYVANDADVDLLLTTTGLAEPVRAVGRDWLALDDAETVTALDRAPADRPVDRSPQGVDDPAAYVIYTSGSSGRPKGVEIAQSSITNFLAVVPAVYDVRPDDRVHQGMTISFDFSIEEIWPTWAVGATLVVGPDDERRLGADLADHLERARVSVLYCVPTLLATIPRDLPGLRSILVGGEACPAELVERWSRPGRRMLNTYGPTEATVTATWCELVPGRPVTIGRPLPTYGAEMIDAEAPDPRPVGPGEVGEITLGGPGVATGYVGMPEKTAEKFVAHPVTGDRVYRTGDLGRWTPHGEIEYLGRADAEVKVRGHRVDLGEIESVLLTDPEVGSAVVALDPGPDGSDGSGGGDLAAYVVVTAGTDEDALATRLAGVLREQLPAYMVPVTLDVLDTLPTQVSGKVDRSQLPAPAGRRLVAATGPVVEAEGELEERIAALWSEALGVPAAELSVTADFFDDLGGHSLLAATTVTLMRERGVGGSPAVRDLYAHPSVRALASHLAGAGSQEATSAAPRPGPVRHRTRRVAAAGAVQAVVLYLFLLAVTLPVSWVYTANDGTVSTSVLAQVLAAGAVAWLGVRWVLPVLLARPLAAGVRTGRYRLWGPTHLRLWTLDLVLRLAPLPVLAGSPFLAPYLRLLGARVGRRTHVATADVTLPRLLHLDDDADVGYGAALHPWAVEDGWVVVGPVHVERGAVAGANTVLAPGSRIGAGGYLAEQSALGRDEAVPAGEAWAGSPPAPREVTDAALDAMRGADPLPGWRARHLPGALAGLLGLEVAAVAMVVPAVLVVWGALLAFGVLAGLVATLLAGPVFVLTVCALVALGRRAVLPRTPVGIHPVHSGLGLRKWVADALLAQSLTFTNSLYATLYTPTWLRLLGARVGTGAEVSTAAHLDPDLLTLGDGSFVADMASVGAATFANGRVLLRPTQVGDRAFVGNAAIVPSGTGTGTGSLVGVHTVPPPEGVPADSSWLGSPAMHLPQRQDSGDYDEQETFRPGRRRVRHRLAVEFVRATLPASLLGLGLYLYLLALSALADGRALLPTALGAPVLAAAASLAVVAYVVAVKRHVVGRYRPRVAPLWDPFVRRTEFVTGLYEAAAVPTMLGLLVGTPFLPMVLRRFGARIGRRVHLATTYLTEFDLVEIGDDAAVGPGVSLQTHLFEDRVMKMSTVRVEAGATVGTRAIVLYDATVGSQVDLDGLSLLMKGEELSGGTRWRGIPARGIAEPDTDAFAAVGSRDATVELPAAAA